MIPRGKLAISFFELIGALTNCFIKKNSDGIIPNQALYEKSIFCLSARTGLDLTLQTLDLAPGTGVLTTSINIPDMFSILKAHQLVPVPISIDKQTLGLNLEELEDAITPSCKVILIAHLFGAIANLDEVILFAKKHQLIIIEDCAQAFNYNYKGHPATDVSLFSFGLIKTNTCLTGAMICFNNQLIYENVKLLNQQLPVQATRKYLGKIFKALAVKVITLKWIYTLLYAITQRLHKDFDAVLAGFTKGFPGENVMEKIKFRPCYANLRLLHKRTHVANDKSIIHRMEIALKILEKIPITMKIGLLNQHHSHWVIPIVSENPTALITSLREKGIDATAKASSLINIMDGNKVGKNGDLNLEDLVYLPIDKAVVNGLKD